MTSERKIAANRRNGQNSRGPRSAAGKAIASRNALRHGLAAIKYREPVAATDLENFAQALCDGDVDPALFEQAVAIAREDYVLRAITEQQLAVIERLHEPLAPTLGKRNNRLQLGNARLQKSREAYDELVALRDRLMEKYKGELPGAPAEADADPLVRLHLRIVLMDKEEAILARGEDPTMTLGCHPEERPEQRSESEVLEAGASELIRLDRYEHRAQARRNRAIRIFIHLKLVKQGRLLEEDGWQNEPKLRKLRRTPARMYPKASGLRLGSRINSTCGADLQNEPKFEKVSQPAGRTNPNRSGHSCSTATTPATNHGKAPPQNEPKLTKHGPHRPTGPNGRVRPPRRTAAQQDAALRILTRQHFLEWLDPTGP